ncbi:MAG: hypothetical protein K5637_02610 [Lachnospiraceae bacterium]|nr:hypothetical protein [Lachnospiraceae bacterium]
MKNRSNSGSLRAFSGIMIFCLMMAMVRGCSSSRKENASKPETAGTGTEVPESQETESAATESESLTETETAAGPATEPAAEQLHYESYYDGSLGFCGDLRGTILVVSIFADDAGTQWDPESDEDRQMQLDTVENLRVAAEYLHEQALNYGSDTEFIYDWTQNEGICYEASFDETLVRTDGGGYAAERNWIADNVDTQALKDRYEADHVVYYIFFNTGFDNSVNPWSIGHTSSYGGENGPFYDIELTNLYVRFKDFVTMPSVYAHEMMHAFGAHDLYYANYYITQEYVDHLAGSGSNDIMYTVTSGHEITNEFTELDAYYTGIADSSDDAVCWGLGETEH